MKSLGNTVSVFKDTNQVFSCSDVDWSTVREGSYFKLSRDNVSYIVGRTSQIYFIKDFEVLSRNEIKVNSNIGPNLIVGDSLVISYKEYELSTLLSISNGGENYKVNDIVSIIGGKVSKDIQTGVSSLISFIVTKVGPKGEIEELGPNTRGRYIQPPNFISFLADGSGVGAVLELEYRIIDDRTTIERGIDNIILQDDKTIITVNFPLPVGLLIGKLSVEKWKIELTQPYIGESAIHENYELCRDFTPNLKLPISVRGNFRMETLYNQSIIILDEQINQLKNTISELRQDINKLKS